MLFRVRVLVRVWLRACRNIVREPYISLINFLINQHIHKLWKKNKGANQPFQMFRYVHLEAFCCKCSATNINNLTKMIFFFPFWCLLTNQKVLSGSLTYFGRNKLISVFRYVHRKIQFFYLDCYTVKFLWCERRYGFVLLILNLVHMTSSCAALFKTIVCLKSEKQSYYFFRYVQRTNEYKNWSTSHAENNTAIAVTIICNKHFLNS